MHRHITEAQRGNACMSFSNLYLCVLLFYLVITRYYFLSCYNKIQKLSCYNKIIPQRILTNIDKVIIYAIFNHLWLFIVINITCKQSVTHLLFHGHDLTSFNYNVLIYKLIWSGYLEGQWERKLDCLYTSVWSTHATSLTSRSLEAVKCWLQGL